MNLKYITGLLFIYFLPMQLFSHVPSCLAFEDGPLVSIIPAKEQIKPQLSNLSTRILKKKKKSNNAATSDISVLSSTASKREVYEGDRLQLSLQASRPKNVEWVHFTIVFEGQGELEYELSKPSSGNVYTVEFSKAPAGSHSWTWTVGFKKSKKTVSSNKPIYFEVLPITEPPTTFSSMPSFSPSSSSAPTTLTQTPSQSPTTQPQAQRSQVRVGLQADCSVIDETRFNICLDIASPSGEYEYWMDAFGAAKQRWEEVIVGDSNQKVENLAQYWAAKSLIASHLPAVTDDLYISARVQPYDGVGGVLGMASPYLLESSTMRPVGGYMIFDAADVKWLFEKGMWKSTILHEMGHVLGLGSLWQDHGLHPGYAYIYVDQYKTDSEAQRIWEQDFCPGGRLPIETAGQGFSYGTAGVHFDEDCVQDELMTGFVDDRMPLSKLTLASLADMGYVIDYDKADAYGRADLGNCKKEYCPGLNRRQLRRRETGDRNQRRLSDWGQEQALKAAATEMSRIRSAHTNVPAGLKLNGGEMLTVFVEDDDGHIKEATVTWEEAQPYAPGAIV